MSSIIKELHGNLYNPTNEKIGILENVCIEFENNNCIEISGEFFHSKSFHKKEILHVIFSAYPITQTFECNIQYDMYNIKTKRTHFNLIGGFMRTQ